MITAGSRSMFPGISRKTMLDVLASFMLSGELHAQKGKDTLFLRNGSAFIGKLKKIRMGVITFDPDDTNDITVQVRKTKTLHATSDVFRIETVQ